MAGWTLTGFVVGWFVGESYHRIDSIKGTIELLRDMKYLTEPRHGRHHGRKKQKMTYNPKKNQYQNTTKLNRTKTPYKLKNPNEQTDEEVMRQAELELKRWESQKRKRNLR